MNVQNAKLRGSARIEKAWKSRALTEESVKEIIEGLGQTKGQIETVDVSGGNSASGMRVGIRYDAELVSWCGNDMTFWLEWLRKYGGRPRKPIIIINGKPVPDELFMQVDFGNFELDRVEQLQDIGQLQDMIQDVRR